MVNFVRSRAGNALPRFEDRWIKAGQRKLRIPAVCFGRGFGGNAGGVAVAVVVTEVAVVDTASLTDISFTYLSMHRKTVPH